MSHNGTSSRIFIVEKKSFNARLFIILFHFFLSFNRKLEQSTIQVRTFGNRQDRQDYKDIKKSSENHFCCFFPKDAQKVYFSSLGLNSRLVCVLVSVRQYAWVQERERERERERGVPDRGWLRRKLTTSPTKSPSVVK